MMDNIIRIWKFILRYVPYFLNPPSPGGGGFIFEFLKIFFLAKWTPFPLRMIKRKFYLKFFLIVFKNFFWIFFWIFLKIYFWIYFWIYFNFFVIFFEWIIILINQLKIINYCGTKFRKFNSKTWHRLRFP